MNCLAALANCRGGFLAYHLQKNFQILNFSSQKDKI